MLGIKVHMLAVLAVYIPFHLFEEALGNFPQWMFEHGYTRRYKISYAFWMAGNIFFYYPCLLISVTIYLLFGEHFLFFGVGVVFWGVLNFLEHLFFTLKDRRISPGMFTSVLFFLIGVLAISKLSQLEILSPRTVLLSTLVAAACAFLPILMQIHIGRRIWPRFEKT